VRKSTDQCLDVVPVPTGEYRVGTAIVDLEDPYRKDLQFPSGRLIPVQYYFPMRKGKHQVYQKDYEERAPGPFEPLVVNVHSKKADLSHLEGNNLPVVILSHGSSVAMTDYAFLAEDLSSHGYFVVSIQHDLLTDHHEPEFWSGRSCSIKCTQNRQLCAK